MNRPVPLRTADERIKFCDTYFDSVGATVVYSAPYYREVELPRDVDKELTDRPYYWMWVETTNQQVPNTVLRLAFTTEAEQRENERLRAKALEEREKQPMTEIERMFFRPPTSELVTLGSFRLDKIYSSIDRRGRFCSVKPQMAQATGLIPWLCINALVSKRCDLVEQEFISIGVCLNNGQIVDGFFDVIRNLPMEPASPSDMLRRATMTIGQGIEAIRKRFVARLSVQDHTWAEEASIRLKKELQQIRTYYISILPDVKEEEKTLVEAERLRKERELIERTEPKIEVDVRQVGLIGLAERQ